MDIIAAIILALVVVDEYERHHTEPDPEPRHYVRHPANIGKDYLP